MNSEQDRILELFERASALSPVDREWFLDDACPRGTALRNEVDSLIAAHDSAGDFLGVVTVAPPPETAPAVGAAQVRETLRLDHIGPYHILELLGTGGMGEVYKAEQRTPIRRTVAIKIIKLGFDSREIIARFESERQALARMDHPNVARVIDAGVTETGRPYFVMEYVPGKPITQFCDDNTLSITDRLLLFVQTCEAINHAHTKALIHRDIKAANVLAFMHDGKPTVKVIDFGIAKALTADRLTDATFNTQQGHVVGTYDSMSPEQADGSPDIDTRTDVYSLGVLLYELLSGAKPFDHRRLARAADQEIRRIIKEVDPPRPSTRLSELDHDSGTKLARLRQSKLDALARALRNELELIPLKAMRKERTRRYSSVQQLSQDVHNYLGGRPLLAGPESSTYRLRKFGRRHRAPIITAVSLALLIAGFVVFYIRSIQTEERKTRAALDDAKRQAEFAQAVSDFLTERVLSRATPDRIPDARVRDAIVTAMLEPAAAGVAEDFKEQPAAEAAVRYALALSYGAIGRADLGVPHGRTALAICRRTFGNDHSSTLTAMNNLAYLLQAQGNLDEAEALFREVVERIPRVLGPEHPHTLMAINNIGYLLHRQGKLAEAEPFLRSALDRSRMLLGDDAPGTLTALNNLGELLRAQRKFDQAEPLMTEVLTRLQRTVGEDHPYTLMAMGNVGLLNQSQGKLDRAEALFREAMERSRRVCGENDPQTLMSMSHMAGLLKGKGDLEQAEHMFREILARASAHPSMGPSHPHTRDFASRQATCLDTLGRRDEAMMLRKQFGLPDPASPPATTLTTRAARIDG